MWTIRDLFDRLGAWGLLAPPRWAAPKGTAVKDDDAGVWACAAALAQGGPFSARAAPDVDDLRRVLWHCRTSAKKIREALSEDGEQASGRGAELQALFSRLLEAEQRLDEAGRVDAVRALAIAVERLEDKELPQSLRELGGIVVDDLVDPTDLELHALIALAKAGMPLTLRLPVDGASRGLLRAVEPLLATVEKEHAAPIEVDLVDVAGGGLDGAWYGPAVAPDENAAVDICADEAAEAQHVAGVIAAARARGVKRIAVALRSLGGDEARFADALTSHGIAVRLRRRPLADAPAGRLLLDLLALRLDGAPRDRLLAVLGSPALMGSLSSEDAARAYRVLRRAAARTDVEDAQHPAGGYRHRLLRMRDSVETDDEKREIDLALAAVERGLGLVVHLERLAPLTAHLEGLVALAAVFDDGAGLGCAEVRALLERSREACRLLARKSDPPVALEAVARIIARLLERVSVTSGVDDEHAVELLALPETWGRSFEMLVVASCVEGKLPRADRPERLLSDADRARINGALGKRALRLLDDDPLEPSPVPRAQALEPMWMLGAIRAAAGGTLLLTCARRDGRGRELSPSVFLLEAQRALGATPGAAHAGRHLERSPSPRSVRAAMARAGNDPKVAIWRAMIEQRARYFFRKKDVDASAVRAPFAFAIDPARVKRAFAGSFGLTPEKPLTPTRLEALADCRVRGFVQHVLKVDIDPPAGNSADARVIGTLAHAVMERFFRERKESGAPPARVTNADRARVAQILDEEAAPLLAGRATGHLGAISAQINWLKTALVRAVSMLARDPLVPGVAPADFEVQIGARTHALPQPPLASVPIDIPGTDRTIHLGGIIDRVDEGPGGRAVIDYKTSSTGTVRKKAHRDALFDKHFQLLLYLRLLEHHRPTPEGTALHGYLVSLRDGTTSSDVGEIDNLRALVTDDTRTDGLAAGIGRVVLPILDGTLIPDAGDRCEQCRLQRFCRVPLAAEYAPDLDDPEEGGGA